MNHFRFVWAVLSMLVAVTASIEVASGQTEAATETKEAAAVDPSGPWKWEYDFNGNVVEFKWKLNWDGKKLTGKYTAFDNTTDIAGRHPFSEAVPRILAPEEDTSSYYRSLGPTLTTADQVAAGPGPADAPPGLSVPPVGVDPAAFFDLQASRRKNTRRQIMEIDKANNNTSVVLELEWRGWRLLFAGDAELGSWKKMHEQNLIKPVHFVKVSHHGSHNGTYDELFDQLMPTDSPDGRDRHALVSTHDGDWDSVPDTDGTLSLYSSRCTLHDTRTLAHGASLAIRFPG